MRKTLGIVLLLMLAQSALARSPQYRNQSNPYDELQVLRGFVVSGYRVDPTERIDTGFGVDVNYSSVALNGGVAYKKFGDSPFRSNGQNDETDVAADEGVTNAYFGVGFSRIIQFQYGYGTEGSLLRLRSDFNLRAIADFFQQQATPKNRLTLGDRLTFTLALESYQGSDEEAFDNVTWGVGLLF